MSVDVTVWLMSVSVFAATGPAAAVTLTGPDCEVPAGITGDVVSRVSAGLSIGWLTVATKLRSAVGIGAPA